MPQIIDGEEDWACPRQGIRENPAYWQQLLFFYNNYKSGFLPDPGALSEQCARLMTIVSILSATFDEADEELSDQRRRQMVSAASAANQAQAGQRR
jgi:hypothetical protein